MPGLEGTTLANRYQDLELLGEGAMAHVYRAYDRQRKCAVALKLLRADYAEDHAFEQRFRVEARTLERLAHHSVVRYYGLERDGRSLFMVMEYVAGETLRTEMFSQAAGLSGKRILEILQPLAAALDFAHASGVLHRDLKPANVLLAADGRVFLSDFGVARMMDASTVTTFVVGTPAYMSPEQCASKELTAASDIYSLAVMAFEMLCGRRPFVGETAGLPPGSLPDLVRMEHLSATPPAVRSFRNALPAGLDVVFAKSLSKVPAERPASAAALVESLARLIKAVPGSATVQLRVAAQAVQLNPVPLLRAISPTQATPDFVGSLAASGSDFVAQSVVHLDGRALPTKFVSAIKVIAEVRVRKNAAVGSRSVTVVNPEPGGGTSNRMLLIVETPEVGRRNWLIVFGLLAVGAIMVLGLSFSTDLSGEASVLAPTAAQVSSAEPPLLATRFPPAPTAVPATEIPSTAVPPTPLIPKRIDPTATVVAAVSAATTAPADEVQQFPTALPTPVSVVGPAVGPAVVTCKNAGEWTGCGGKSELGLCAANEVGQCTDKLIYKCVLDTKCNGVAAPQVAASAAIAPGPLPSSGSAARTCSNKGEWTACGGKAELGICAPKEVGHCTDQNVYECVVDNNKCGAPSNASGASAGSFPPPTIISCKPNGGLINISGVRAWWVEHRYSFGVYKYPGNGNTGTYMTRYERAIYTALDGSEGNEWCRGDLWK